MRQYLAVPVAVALLLVSYQYHGQSSGVASSSITNQEEDRLARAKDRPDLAVDVAKVARFKIASRKTIYHLGEMMNVDVALLNISEQPLYFQRLLTAEAYTRDPQGIEIHSTKYFVSDTMPRPQTYVLQNPNRVSFTSHQLLSECDRRAFEQVRMQLNAATESKKLFENDSFVFWGESCLDIRYPGTYTLTFEITNWFVVVSTIKGDVRTAVGTLRSNPLMITIIR